ncbi:MAG: hypothetical protein J3R72DRAFT_530714 [Linnemannia gamsii]|nr:MAG: hypothetical protein J3R72DRAFT_530714 [Linnemannia gamsii]
MHPQLGVILNVMSVPAAKKTFRAKGNKCFIVESTPFTTHDKDDYKLVPVPRPRKPTLGSNTPPLDWGRLSKRPRSQLSSYSSQTLSQTRPMRISSHSFSFQRPLVDFGEGSSSGSGSFAQNSTQIRKRKEHTLRRTKELQMTEQDFTSLRLMSTLSPQQLHLPNNASRGKPIVTQASSPIYSSPSSSPAKSIDLFAVEDIVIHRSKDIMAARYDWLDSPRSRLFVILHHKDNIGSVAEVITMDWQDFGVHFLCDCMNLPGAGIDLPHIDLNESANLFLQKERQAFGPHTLAVLEMLKDGVVIEEKTKMRAMQDLGERKLFVISVKQPLGWRIPFPSTDGDVRWICSTCWNQLMVWDHISEAFAFSENPNSNQTAFHLNIGSFGVTLKTRERAREFYGLASRLESTLCDIGRQCSLPQNRSLLPQGGPCGHQEQADPSPSIERTPCVNSDPANDPFKNPVHLDPILTRISREQESGKIQLDLLVADLDTTVSLTCKGIDGFRQLPTLTLESSHGNNMSIDFDTNVIGEDEVNTDYAEQSDIKYFNKRSSDAITIRIFLPGGPSLLLSNALKDVNISISFPEDDSRIREIIKRNRRLSLTELVIETKDDPYQVFEHFKASMVNHPSLVAVQINKDWGSDNKPGFVWYGVSNRTKMTLAIQSYAEDRVGPLLHKFGPHLLQLFIHSINEQDSATLERVTAS